MSTEHQGRLSRWSQSGPTQSELRSLYEDCGGQISSVAARLEMNRETARQRLIDAGIHEPKDYDPLEDEQYLPQDWGLSVLRCVECHAELHDGHPCPECGFDPREGNDE